MPNCAGLPQSLRDAAAAAATTRKQTGWLIQNTRSAVDPFLTYSDRRDLREKAWRMFVNRGDNGDEHDNNATITQILAFARNAPSFWATQPMHTGASKTRWPKRLSARWN